jgi:hypothetical protein
MNPLGTRTRSEELARLLDGGGAGTAALVPYGGVAIRLQNLGAELGAGVAPRPEFRDALRTRLLAVAAVQAHNAETVSPPVRARAVGSAVSWSQSRRAQRGIGLAAGAMASVVAVAGVAVAGSQSLPGDPFYSVKRGAEALELRTTSGAVAKGSKHLAFAAERLKEVRELSLGRDSAYSGPVGHPLAADAFGGSTSTRIRSALSDMDSETRTGSALLTSAYRSSNDDAPLEILSRFAGRQSRELQALLPSVPAAARPSAAQSLALVSGVAAQTSQLLALGVCTGQCSPTAAAPSLPPAAGGPQPAPAPTATTTAPCGCQPAPDPAQTGAPAPAATPQPSTAPEPSSTPAPSPTPSSPHSPSPRPTASPLPVVGSPAPVPLPTLPSLPPLPVPLPTITPPALPGAVESLVPSLPLG